MKQVLQLIKYLLPWASTGVVVAIVALALWRIPNWDSPNSVTDPREKAELANANRDMALRVLQTLGGLGFIATAFLAWRNLQLTEDQQVSNRFGQAVKMLADEELEVRLGGIYLLERIAKDSREDHPVVMEVLTAFIREKTTAPLTQAASFTLVSLLPDNMPISTPEPEPVEPASCPQDIQSALTVIGRREAKYDVRSLDLNGANLYGAKLHRANLQEAILNRVNLREAVLIDANLQRAWLYRANLQEAGLHRANLHEAELNLANLYRARLGEANLREAALVDANLQRAWLDGANLQEAILNRANLQKAVLDTTNLQGAVLEGSNLQGARLYRANLEGARLEGANLEGARLNGTNLEGARLYRANLQRAELDDANLQDIKFDSSTQWPAKEEIAKAKNIPPELMQQLGLESPAASEAGESPVEESNEPQS
ncbi:pentapeptide repeat-containing protein [Vacuolonema iberomarrocanum]|uniref:pentapeptide repeat-containing protein n=1 Tax=Vacuolonema iberomarrocanum TaxID=3454632 RepID=UPI0019FB8264|nr:pentapeptide repeat-containing protein [filamentous cyanobacterium LEGE 07170]